MPKVTEVNKTETVITYEAIPQLPGINPNLRNYVEQEIFPRYSKFFAHGIHHIYRVIADALMLAEYYHKDFNITYAAAACHDLGLKVNRAEHERASGKIIAADKNLLQFFSPAELQVVREAAEDHRGSRKTPPRSFYGRMISDADRDFDLATNAWRSLTTSVKNYPELATCDEQFELCYEYLSRRITDGKHFNLWTNNPTLIKRRDKFERGFLDRDYCHTIYTETYNRMKEDGTLKKILTYYEDF